MKAVISVPIKQLRILISGDELIPLPDTIQKIAMASVEDVICAMKETNKGCIEKKRFNNWAKRVMKNSKKGLGAQLKGQRR